MSDESHRMRRYLSFTAALQIIIANNPLITSINSICFYNSTESSEVHPLRSRELDACQMAPAQNNRSMDAGDKINLSFGLLSAILGLIAVVVAIMNWRAFVRTRPTRRVSCCIPTFGHLIKTATTWMAFCWPSILIFSKGPVSIAFLPPPQTTPFTRRDGHHTSIMGSHYKDIRTS